MQGVLVHGLPTLLLYNNGVPLATHSGVITNQELFEWLDDKLVPVTGSKSEIDVVKVPEREEQDVASKVPTGGKRGFVSFADRYTF